MALAKIGVGLFRQFVHKRLAQSALNIGDRTVSTHVLKPQGYSNGLNASYNPVKSALRNFALAVHSVKEIRERVVDVVSNYDKVSNKEINEQTHFIQDLGLDSLDHVEIMMLMEDEFGFEIPDADAEKLMKLEDVIKYIAKRQNIKDEEEPANPC